MREAWLHPFQTRLWNDFYSSTIKSTWVNVDTHFSEPETGMRMDDTNSWVSKTRAFVHAVRLCKRIRGRHRSTTLVLCFSTGQMRARGSSVLANLNGMSLEGVRDTVCRGYRIVEGECHLFLLLLFKWRKEADMSAEIIILTRYSAEGSAHGKQKATGCTALDEE